LHKPNLFNSNFYSSIKTVSVLTIAFSFHFNAFLFNPNLSIKSVFLSITLSLSIKNFSFWFYSYFKIFRFLIFDSKKNKIIFAFIFPQKTLLKCALFLVKQYFSMMKCPPPPQDLSPAQSKF